MSDINSSSTSNLPNPFKPNINGFKVVIVGDSQVGKTTFLYALKNNIFRTDIEPTIGSNITDISYDYNGKQINFNIFDTAGQEIYQSLATFYMRGTTCALICFDPRFPNYTNSINKWKEIVLRECPQIKIIAIAMKSDLWSNDLMILNSYQTVVQNKCDILDVLFTSSLTPNGSFEFILRCMADKCIESLAFNPSSFPEVAPIVLQPNQSMKNQKCDC